MNRLTYIALSIVVALAGFGLLFEAVSADDDFASLLKEIEPLLSSDDLSSGADKDPPFTVNNVGQVIPVDDDASYATNPQPPTDETIAPPPPTFFEGGANTVDFGGMINVAGGNVTTRRNTPIIDTLIYTDTQLTHFTPYTDSVEPQFDYPNGIIYTDTLGGR